MHAFDAVPSGKCMRHYWQYLVHKKNYGVSGHHAGLKLLNKEKKMFETANDHCAGTKKGEDSYICITKPMTNVLMRGSSHP